MSTSFADRGNLRRAWARAKADLAGRTFVRPPFDQAIIEFDLESWLDGLHTQLATGAYRPRSSLVCDVPKGNGAVRPGMHLRTVDRVVFAACVGACFQAIHSAVLWSQHSVDFSYLLSEKPDGDKWLRNSFSGWKEFQNATLNRITDDVSHVVFTDITGFYEHVHLAIVMSDLREIGAPDDAIAQLSTCLNRWAECAGKGIPQGHAPADILGKLYLNRIDEALQENGIQHVRYVDDYRIFCGSLTDARRAILELTRLLRRRGLSLQNAKTEILPAEEARLRVNAVSERVLAVKVDFHVAIEMAIEAHGHYAFNDYSEELLNDDPTSPDNPPSEVLRVAFDRQYLSPYNDEESAPVPRKFEDSTFFHYLLSELGKRKDPIAVEYCWLLLETNPEETSHICKYLERLGCIAKSDARTTAFLKSSNSIYDYQFYQLVEWRLKDVTPPTEELLQTVRGCFQDKTRPSYLHSLCRRFLGEFGTVRDLDRILASYEETHDEWQQCEILCCLKRMERVRRNEALTRRSETPLHVIATKLVRQNLI